MTRSVSYCLYHGYHRLSQLSYRTMQLTHTFKVKALATWLRGELQLPECFHALPTDEPVPFISSDSVPAVISRASKKTLIVGSGIS